MNETLIDTKETARLLGIADKTIRNRVSDGSWPLAPVRIGRSLRWRRSDVARIISGEIAVPTNGGPAGASDDEKDAGELAADGPKRTGRRASEPDEEV